MKMRWMSVALLSAVCASASAADMKVSLKMATEKGEGANIGTVTVSENKHGVVFTPDLKDLTPGLHGFHIHANGNCGPNQKDGKTVPAGAAGGHLDPAKTDKHGTPWGDGHLGDLPALTVDAKGVATNPVLAPRLKMADIKGKALMVHVGGDNHSDHPAPLGGGGGRMACGVIQ